LKGTSGQDDSSASKSIRNRDFHERGSVEKMAPALSGGNLEAIRHLTERNGAPREEHGKRLGQAPLAAPAKPASRLEVHSPDHETRAQSPENPADFSEPETGAAMSQDVPSGSEPEQLKLENADL